MSKLIRKIQKGIVLYNSNDSNFNNFIRDVAKYAPKLAKYNPNYNMYRYWELNDKPKTFNDGRKKGMFVWYGDGFHANSVAKANNNTYEFMKQKGHPTRWMELDWYNNGPYSTKIQVGEALQNMPKNLKEIKYHKSLFNREAPSKEQWLEWLDFKNNYKFVEETDKKPAMYIKK